MNNTSEKMHGPVGQGGPPRVQLRIQTPRGLWSMTEPEAASQRPEYPQPAKVQEVIDDARAVFKFVEADNQYTLFHDGQKLEPQRTLVSYGLANGTLLLMSVQGGNA